MVAPAPTQALTLVDLLQQPAVIAGSIGAAVAVLGLLVNTVVSCILQWNRQKAEQTLARDRFDHEVRLARRKVALDQQLELWRRKVAFAEESLTDFYDVRFTMNAVRSGASYSTEVLDRPGRADEPEALRQARDTYYPVLRRIRDKENVAGFTRLWARRFRARALFGADADAPFTRFRRVLAQVQTAAEALMRENTHSEFGHAPAFKEQCEARVWDHGDGDPTSLELDQIVVSAEAIFRPVLDTVPAAE